MNSPRESALRESVRESLQSRVTSRVGGAGVGSSVVARRDDGKYESIYLKDVAQIYLIVEGSCPGCTDAMEEFADDIADGTVKLLSVDDDLGFKFVNDLGIQGVPALVIELKDGRYFEFKQE